MTFRGGEKFYPKGCDYDIYVNMQGNLKKTLKSYIMHT
uniref:RmpA2 n=1 Tax=Klebsiella pneumoniae TaxID=573 RepID=A0A2H5BSP7_KLEPN|nr:RmpA2 [Klebsiella pneumoniae]